MPLESFVYQFVLFGDAPDDKSLLGTSKSLRKLGVESAQTRALVKRSRNSENPNTAKSCGFVMHELSGPEN